MNKPAVNVTPLIDVLLVLLIIFMVVAPLKPSGFKARVPSESNDTRPTEPHPDTLVVHVGIDSSITLNNESDLGSTNDASKLTNRLKEVFDKRIANGNASASFAEDSDRPMADRIERTVFIKAPKALRYGSVTRIVDAVKLGGAYPISLQIDRLD